MEKKQNQRCVTQFTLEQEKIDRTYETNHSETRHPNWENRTDSSRLLGQPTRLTDQCNHFKLTI